MIKQIISGAQTGADRAGLDFAIRYNISYTGYVPEGRRSEDGTVPTKYILKEMDTASYFKRTEKNVIESDATVILSRGELGGGSSYTREMARKYNRPWLHLNLNILSIEEASNRLKNWLEEKGIKRLNIAGSRESKDPKIYDLTMKILEGMWMSYEV